MVAGTCLLDVACLCWRVVCGGKKIEIILEHQLDDGCEYLNKNSSNINMSCFIYSSFFAPGNLKVENSVRIKLCLKFSARAECQHPALESVTTVKIL